MITLMLWTILYFAVISLATAAISYTISKTKIFQGFREVFNEDKFFGKLIRCPFCVSWYAALFLLGISGGKVSSGLLLMSAAYEPGILFEAVYLLISTSATVCLSAFWVGIVDRAFSFME